MGGRVWAKTFVGSLGVWAGGGGGTGVTVMVYVMMAQSKRQETVGRGPYHRARGERER